MYNQIFFCSALAPTSSSISQHITFQKLHRARGRSGAIMFLKNENCFGEKSQSSISHIKLHRKINSRIAFTICNALVV